MISKAKLGAWTCSGAEACFAAGLDPGKVRVWGHRGTIPTEERYDVLGLMRLCVVAELVRNEVNLSNAAKAVERAVDQAVTDLSAGKPGYLVITRLSANDAAELDVSHRSAASPVAMLFPSEYDNGVAIVVSVGLIRRRAKVRLGTKGLELPE